ncbi:MAG: RagB/SusD family nutrient uptake outer membrane protein, partial [Saprospiraceae bacterium]|nr:RagB/SusD family nutrient uptake outer membrane protein [Saprospiraceae bacterium]
ALSALNNSFMDMGGDMNNGGYYSFGGATGNDLPNPLFYVPGVDNYMAHPSWADEAEAGDTRLSKVSETGSTITLDGLSGSALVSLYPSNSSAASIIRNEELILIAAEANIGGNNTAAVDALNVIRVASGLAPYSGGMDDASLTDEVLKQRRYSLFGEGHRWIDLRRNNRLDQIPLDRAGDKVHVQFPRPASENG